MAKDESQLNKNFFTLNAQTFAFDEEVKVTE